MDSVAEIAEVASSDLSCPFCGDGPDYDAPGLIGHIDRCDKADEARDVLIEDRRKFHELMVRNHSIDVIARFAQAVRAYLEQSK